MRGSHGWDYRHSEACPHQLEDAGKLIGFEYGVQLCLGAGAGHQDIVTQAVIRHFYKADPSWGRGVVEGLALRAEEVLTGELASTGD
jgi:hypothetical protein